jgi:hypothetical protein
MHVIEDHCAGSRPTWRRGALFAHHDAVAVRINRMNILKLDHLVSMIAAPIIWAVHFVVCYVLVSLACALGWTGIRMLGMEPAALGIAVATLGALVLLAYTGALNYAKYRRAPSAPSGSPDISAFIALNSLLLTALSAVALIWVAFPALILPTCAL